MHLSKGFLTRNIIRSTRNKTRKYRILINPYVSSFFSHILGLKTFNKELSFFLFSCTNAYKTATRDWFDVFFGSLNIEIVPRTVVRPEVLRVVAIMVTFRFSCPSKKSEKDQSNEVFCLFGLLFVSSSLTSFWISFVNNFVKLLASSRNLFTNALFPKPLETRSITVFLLLSSAFSNLRWSALFSSTSFSNTRTDDDDSKSKDSLLDCFTFWLLKSMVGQCAK